MIFLNKVSKSLLRSYFLTENNLCGVVTFNSRQRPNLKNVEIIERYPFINSVFCKFSKSGLFNIANSVAVSYISSLAEVSCFIDISKKAMSIENVILDKYYGKGKTVAILDSGIFPHLDFLTPSLAIKHFEDVINHKNYIYDDCGHGTMVAGVSCGRGTSSCGRFQGVASMADIVAVKCMKADGSGSTLDILRAMQWVYDNRRKYNINVVIMSLGAEPNGAFDPLSQGVKTLISCGLIVVVANGNDGPSLGSVKSPAICKEAISVGSFCDFRGAKNNYIPCDFSSRGSKIYPNKPDFLAPGSNITSTSIKNQEGRFYNTFSGTSVSAGIVGGICAVLSEKYDTQNPHKIKEILKNNCYRSTEKEFVEGAGLLNFSKI